MTVTIEIEGCSLLVYGDKTQQSYLTQENIVDDCQCSDCKFYSETFTKEPLEIFSILSSFGVDLQKNLSSEPTGVWCVRDENDIFLYCRQVYHVVRQFSKCDKSRVKYEKQENDYNVNAVFFIGEGNIIDIELNIYKT